MLQLPEVLNTFNLYSDAEKLIGQDGEITLPELTMINDTLNGSGVLGEIEDPVTGQFESAQVGIKWTCLNHAYFTLMNTTKPVTLTLRASIQCMDKDTGFTDYYPCKIVVRGKAKTINLGKAEKGKKMECETEMEVIYIKVVLDGETLLELDKLNFKYILNGEDMLQKIRGQI
jgi:hypothetical protein